MDKWIKCSEKLPPKNQWVLCYCDKKYIKQYHVGRMKITGNVMEVHHFPLDDQIIVVPYTHWMPLPNPPKENE